jgi:hypothetical protein
VDKFNYEIGVLYYSKPKDDIAKLCLLIVGIDLDRKNKRSSLSVASGYHQNWRAIVLTSYSYSPEERLISLPKSGKSVRLATEEEIRKFMKSVFEEEAE